MVRRKPKQPIDERTHEHIDLVHNLIERCLQQFMTRDDVLTLLFNRYNLESHYVLSVWQQLEKDNPEFFRNYYASLELKKQSQREVEQVHLMSNSKYSSATQPCLPNNNISHLPVHYSNGNSATHILPSIGTSIESSHHGSLDHMVTGFTAATNFYLMQQNISAATDNQEMATTSNRQLSFEPDGISWIGANSMTGATFPSHRAYTEVLQPELYGGRSYSDILRSNCNQTNELINIEGYPADQKPIMTSLSMTHDMEMDHTNFSTPNMSLHPSRKRAFYQDLQDVSQAPKKYYGPVTNNPLYDRGTNPVVQPNIICDNSINETAALQSIPLYSAQGRGPLIQGSNVANNLSNKPSPSPVLNASNANESIPTETTPLKSSSPSSNITTVKPAKQSNDINQKNTNANSDASRLKLCFTNFSTSFGPNDDHSDLPTNMNNDNKDGNSGISVFESEKEGDVFKLPKFDSLDFSFMDHLMP